MPVRLLSRKRQFATATALAAPAGFVSIIYWWPVGHDGRRRRREADALRDYYYDARIERQGDDASPLI